MLLSVSNSKKLLPHNHDQHQSRSISVRTDIVGNAVLCVVCMYEDSSCSLGVKLPSFQKSITAALIDYTGRKKRKFPPTLLLN